MVFSKDVMMVEKLESQLDVHSADVMAVVKEVYSEEK
jgi:hypothetical protein